MNRLLLIPAVCALALAACDGRDSVKISSTTTQSDGEGEGVLKVIDNLQCPQTMGSLNRKGTASAGGAVCTYAGPRGTEVILHLVPLDGSNPAEVLRAFEDRLSQSLPRAVEQLAASADASARAEAASADASARAEAASADAAARGASAEADEARVSAPGVAIRAKGDDATVKMPGLHIEADGDKASVRIGGFTIDADDTQGTVNIEGSDEGGDEVSVQANNDAAEVRTNSSGAATRANWILTDNRASEAGWRVVGYEARGPIGGPLVVATIRSRDRDRGQAFEDAKDLVTLNVGE